MTVMTRVGNVPKPKPKGGESNPEKTTTIKVRGDLHRRARTVASYLGLELIDYVDQILRPIVDQAYADMGKEIRKEGDE